MSETSVVDVHEPAQLKRIAVRWAYVQQGLFCVFSCYAISYGYDVSVFARMRSPLSGMSLWEQFAWTLFGIFCLSFQLVAWWNIGRRRFVKRSTLYGILLLSLLPCTDMFHLPDSTLMMCFLGVRCAIILILLTFIAYPKGSWWQTRPEAAIQQLANRYVRFQSALALLTFLWGAAVVMNFPMLYGSWMAIQTLTEVDRTLWLQFFGTLIPMVITVLLIVWSTIASCSKRFKGVPFLSRGYRIGCRCMIVAMMLPMLGDLLLFGAYFVYPIRVVFGITLLIWTRRPLFTEMMQLWHDVRQRV